MASQDDTLFDFDADRAGDHDDHTRDHGDHTRDHGDHAGDHSCAVPFERKPGHQYAENYPDPITGHPLQTYPSRRPEEFDSIEDWFKYQQALARWTNYLPPPRPIPKGEEFSDTLPPAATPRRFQRKSVKSRHVGIRLTEHDFKQLDELARGHAVPPGTMARMLIVRAIRAVAGADNP
jgi:hypothetical protein